MDRRNLQVYRNLKAVVAITCALLTVSCVSSGTTRKDLQIAGTTQELSQAQEDLDRATHAIEAWLKPDAAHGVLLHIRTGGRTAIVAPHKACDGGELIPALIDLKYQAPWEGFCSHDTAKYRGYSNAANKWYQVAKEDGSIDAIICQDETYVNPQNHAQLEAILKSPRGTGSDVNPLRACYMAVENYKDLLRRRDAAMHDARRTN